jgi:hypothetical protein
MTTCVTELAVQWIVVSAILAGNPKLISTFFAEFSFFSIAKLTFRTLHLQCPLLKVMPLELWRKKNHLCG